MTTEQHHNLSTNPLVTIVALCYNQARYAEETLDSLLAQTYDNIQLIIMDDASTDNSVEIINNWIKKNNVDCTFIVHNKNKGICKTLNEALSLAKGDYFQLIACDDIYFSNKTEVQLKYLESNPQAAMVYSDALLINDDSTPHYGLFIQRHRNFSRLPEGNIFNTLIEGNFIPAMSPLIRTSIIRSIGGWDNNLQYEDYDFWLRLAKKYSIGCYTKPLVKYRIHSSNMHLNIPFEIQKLKIFKKHLDSQLAKDKYNEIFFFLYRKKKLSKIDREEYYNLNPKSKSAILIKLGLSYNIYKNLIKIF